MVTDELLAADTTDPAAAVVPASVDKFGTEPLMGKFQTVAIIIALQHNAAKCIHNTITT